MSEIRRYVRERLHKRIAFWLSDHQYDWIEKTLPAKWQDRVIDAVEKVVEKPGQWLLCKLLGHIPIADCEYPEHDCCAWCRKGMTPHGGST